MRMLVILMTKISLCDIRIPIGFRLGDGLGLKRGFRPLKQETSGDVGEKSG